MNQTWHEYALADGLFTGRAFMGCEADRDLNTSAGCGWVTDVSSWRAQRVEMAPDDFGDQTVPVVVDFIPPSPPATELVDWAWDTDHREWIAVDTVEAVRRRARAEVVAILAALDATLARPLAEALEAMFSGAVVAAESTSRIVAVNAEKAALREILAGIEAAEAAEGIEALRVGALAHAP